MNTRKTGRAKSRGFTLVEIMIVVVIIGLLASMAIPAFKKVRETSQTKAIHNNLRQLASGADQYFLEHGVVEVEVSQLTGTDAYVKEFDPVAQEEYPELIAQGVDIVVTNAPGGGDIAWEF
jgi:type IV pilus assembly protein PilA